MRFAIVLVLLAACSSQPEYRLTFETLSGDCGDIPPRTGRLDDVRGQPISCSFDSGEWGPGPCKLDRTVAPDGTVRITVSENGLAQCVGVYRVRTER